MSEVVKPKRRRQTASVIAAVLVLAMLLTGTFAWQSISQQALNQAKGKTEFAGGRLHDDFEVMGEDFGLNEWTDGATANKDVYIENFESLKHGGKDIFVRIRLFEYMEVGTGANLSPGDDGYDAREATSLVAGADRDDYTTWAPRVPGANDDSDMFRSIWDWNMGGQKDYMPTFNKDPYSKESDVKGDAVDPQGVRPGEVPNTTNPQGSAAYDADAGLHDYFVTNPTKSAQVKTADKDGNPVISPNPVEHEAKPTLDATVMTMEEWIAAGSNMGPFWVIDEDGWAYWAQPLSPETATGLLLNSITLLDEPRGEWYYGIFVDAQMATADSWKKDEAGGGFYQPDLSSDAENLLNLITGNQDND